MGICHKVFEVALIRAAFLLAFFGALRISELVAQSKSDSSGWALQLADVECLEVAGVCVWARASKNDDQLSQDQVLSLPA